MATIKKQVASDKKIINTQLLKEKLGKFPRPNYSVILVVLLVAAAFLIGRLSAQVEFLKGGGVVAAQPTTQPAAAQQQAKPEVTLDQVKELFKKGNIAFGDKNRKLLFVEFADPSCPFCHVASGLNGELNKQMGAQFTLAADGGAYVAPVPEMRKLVDQGKASFVWLYANGHGNGEMGTKALYCANEKGRFWQAHDLLMSSTGYELMNTTVKNDKTKSAEVANFLKNAVNEGDMKKCLDSGKYDNRIADDMKVAAAFGFSGTPDFYANTTNFVGAYSFKDMQSVVDAALK